MDAFKSPAAAYTPASASGPTLGSECGRTLPLPFYHVVNESSIFKYEVLVSVAEYWPNPCLNSLKSNAAAAAEAVLQLRRSTNSRLVLRMTWMFMFQRRLLGDEARFRVRGRERVARAAAVNTCRRRRRRRSERTLFSTNSWRFAIVERRSQSQHVDSHCTHEKNYLRHHVVNWLANSYCPSLITAVVPHHQNAAAKQENAVVEIRTEHKRHFQEIRVTNTT